MCSEFLTPQTNWKREASLRSGRLEKNLSSPLHCAVDGVFSFFSRCCCNSMFKSRSVLFSPSSTSLIFSFSSNLQQSGNTVCLDQLTLEASIQVVDKITNIISQYYTHNVNIMGLTKLVSIAGLLYWIDNGC